jgi:hypothetical protein
VGTYTCSQSLAPISTSGSFTGLFVYLSAVDCGAAVHHRRNEYLLHLSVCFASTQKMVTKLDLSKARAFCSLYSQSQLRCSSDIPSALYQVKPCTKLAPSNTFGGERDAPAIHLSICDQTRLLDLVKDELAPGSVESGWRKSSCPALQGAADEPRVGCG